MGVAAILFAIFAGLLAFALSLFLPFAVRPLLQRLGIMDVPNARSSHERPVLRGMGLAVLLAFIGGAAPCILLLQAVPGRAVWVFMFLLLATVAAGVLGFAEDLRGVSVLWRSISLLVIAGGSATALLILVAKNGGAHLVFVQDVELSGISLAGNVLLWVYAVLFVSSYINVANFMDGLNGISAFHAVLAGVTFAICGVVTGKLWLTFAGILLIGAFGGFIPWNFSARGAFLGDVGSYMLGGSVALLSFAALLSGVPVLATIGPMCIYFGDVGVTLVKRVRRGERWDEPHKEHVYQRIQQLGYSHAAASGITVLCSAIVSVLGLATLFTGPIFGLLALLGGFCVFGVYLALPRLLPKRGAH